MKSWPNVATKQLQSRKKVQQKYRDPACKANFFPFYLTQTSKIFVATSHSMVRLETIEISEQRTAFIWIFAQEVDWCIKDCDKERLQTTAFINVWKIFPGYTGDWFDVKIASTCTTELWDALKSFILDSLKIKVAPHHIIGLASDDVRKPSNAWQRGKLVLNKDCVPYKSMLGEKSLAVRSSLFFRRKVWKVLTTLSQLCASHIKRFRRSDKWGAVFRSIDDFPACFCMGRCLCLEPILPVATPVAALWRSTCKPYSVAGHLKFHSWNSRDHRYHQTSLSRTRDGTGRKKRKGRNHQKRKIMHDPKWKTTKQFVILYTPECLIC